MNVADMAGACLNGSAAPVASSAFHAAGEMGVHDLATRYRTLPWFAIRVREKLRATTEQHLQAIACEFFSPVTTETRQWSDRMKVVEVPLFSGYLFCQFDPERQLAILRTPGVMDLVRTGARPAEVDPKELQHLKHALQMKVPAEALPTLVCGERVRVMRGAMRGVEGVLLTLKSELKLVLAVTMMNRSVAVEIDRRDVAAIQAD